MTVTTVLIVLSFLAGAYLTRLFSTRPAPVEPRSPRYADSSSGARAALAATRLFNPGDQLYLGFGGDRDRLRAKLRCQRRYAMRLFLRQTREEFRSIMREGAEAAKHETPEFGSALARQSMRFHRLYFGLWLRSQLACVLFRPIPNARIEELAGLARGRRNRSAPEGAPARA